MREEIQETRLDNGLVVLTDRMQNVRSVTLGFFYRIGSRHEPIELHGISHFIEHAVFKGTSRRSALDIAIEQERLGGNLDAFTTHEETGFAVKVIDDQTPRAFDLISDMLTSPRFDEVDLEAEQRVIIEEMKMIDDSPEEYLGELFSEAFFPEHPLGRSIAGTPDTVKRFGHECTNEYHRQAFSPGNLVIAAAGNVVHSEWVELARSGFFAENHPVGETPRPLLRKEGSIAPHPSTPFLIEHREDLEQAHMILATPFVGATDSRRYAADMLTNIIGGGTASRLWQKVREEKGLAYSVGASAAMYQDCGVFSIFAGTSPEHVRELTSIAVNELADITTSGVTDDELDLAKQQARASILLSLEDSASRAAAIAQSEMVHGRQIPVEETLANVEGVTADECRELAAEFFVTDQLAFAAIGDLETLALDRGILVD